jgi:aerobic-type carbon monoxide dehydrogenase small subunit (CoxS/CutS family)
MSSPASPNEFTMEVALTVNGPAAPRRVAPRQTLVDFLREALAISRGRPWDASMACAGRVPCGTTA